MTKNPFQVLGLDTRELKDLKIDQLQRVIESQYRALQNIHHPDRGGSGEKSRELNWAKGELATEDSLKQWLEISLKKGRRSKLESDLERVMRLVRNQQDFSLKLYVGMYRLGLAGQYVDLLGIREGPVFLSRGPYVNKDVLMTGFGKEIEDKEERRQAREQERQRIINRSFYKLSVAGGKLLEEDYAGVVKDISDRLLVGVVTDDTVRRYFDMKAATIHQFLAKVCPVSGEKPRTELPFRYRVGGNDELVIDISMSRFVFLFPYLTLSAKVAKLEMSHLFSMRIINDRPTFRFEGQLRHNIPKASVTG